MSFHGCIVAKQKNAKAKRTNRTPKRAPARKRTKPDWGPAFLAALSLTANIHAACVHAKISRSVVYERRDSDDAFAQAMREALDDATDDLELEARRRAHDGVRKPVIYKGELMGRWVGPTGEAVADGKVEGAKFIPLTVLEYSDSLLMFLLKAHRPAVYRDSVKVTHAGDAANPVKVSGQVQHDHQLDPAAFAAFAADMAAAGLDRVQADGDGQSVGQEGAKPSA